MRAVRVATYNIHKCQGLDRRTRVGRIADVLKEIDADVVAMQEVVSRLHDGPEDDQAGYLAQALGYEMAFGENRRHLGGGYGNATLSRLPIADFANLDLSVAGREPRGCLRTDVRLDGKATLRVFNVHLGTSFLERRLQGPRLVSAECLGNGASPPRVVMGDFNEWTHGLASHLLGGCLRSADRKLLRGGRSYPGLLPMLHLDHIYHDAGLTLCRLYLHRSRLALVASDHLPLVAELEVAG